MGRRSVWSDERIQRISKQFVLAADEVWRLQGGRDAKVWRERGGSDPECIAFQDMAAEGHYGPGPGSKQGIYVCTPDARFLASINSNRAHEVAAVLAEGLAAWRALPESRRSAKSGASAPNQRFEWLWPKGGLGLTTTLRYLPENADPSAKKHEAFNHDALWFSKAEARSFLPAELTPGAKHRLGRELFERIARFNLVDAVRGETRAFRGAEGSISTEITAVDGDLVEIEIAGRTTARGSPRRRGLSSPLGIHSELLGKARFDRSKGQFVTFEIVAKGVRWRRPRRGRDGRPRGGAPVRPIGWLFSLTPERDDGFYVAPTHIRQYAAEWSRSGRRQKRR